MRFLHKADTTLYVFGPPIYISYWNSNLYRYVYTLYRYRVTERSVHKLKPIRVIERAKRKPNQKPNQNLSSHYIDIFSGKPKEP